MKNIIKTLLCLILLASSNSCNNKYIEADILIKNGKVYNGIDSTYNNNSIAIKDDKIIFIGKQNTNIKATKTIDAKGLVVCPGFIDPHTHADRDLVDKEKSHNKPFLFQGITTVIVGNDGGSFYPSSKYIKIYNKNGIGTNAVLIVGHGTIREVVIGKSNRLATKEEMEKMKNLIQEEMNNGVFGMSTGLFYSPGNYANTDEIITLSKVIAKNDGIYDTHLRDEGINLLESIKEAIQIGREAKLPIHISHIKCLGLGAWDKSKKVIEIIEKAQSEGIEITANQYPYDASGTSLKSALIPRWAESGGIDSLFIRYKDNNLRKKILSQVRNNIKFRGGADKLLIVKASSKSLLGKTLLEIAKSTKQKPEISVFNLLKTGYIRVASFNMKNSDINNFMVKDWVVTGSDGNTGHPRKYGSFPRKYSKYVKEEKLINMAKFINNSSSKTADIFKIKKRGKLKEGYFADIIIFQPDKFKDIADYENAFKLSQGIEYSIINGKISIEEGKYKNKLNGRVLKK